MPTESTEFTAPVFRDVTAVDTTMAGNIVLQFRSHDEKSFRIEIAKRIIGTTIMMILGALKETRPATLDTDRRHSDEIKSLRLTALRPMLTPAGAPGLALVLQNHLEVSLELKREAIPALKNVLDQLDTLTAPGKGGPEH